MKRKLMLLLACFFMGIGLVTAQTQQITGTVISADDGQPIAGASISVKGAAKIGTITDNDGHFALKVPSTAKTLRVTYIGMAEQDVAIKPNLKIEMHAEDNVLVDVIITGYGSGQKIGSVTGSVSTVSSAKLKNQPTPNFTDALQGQVSGLSVLSGSGEPTSSASIRLRGVNSITSGTSPLYILDGAPITAVAFNSLNPSDIENVTVLKDASSTAIYGSRAANGVIVITSKRGKMGLDQKAHVTLRASYGVSRLIDNRVDMMGSSDYFKFREILDPTLAADASWAAHKKVINDNGISTDWTDYVFRKNTPTYQLTATAVGGGANTNYYISLDHMSMQGIEPMSDMRRDGLRTNYEARLNDWLKVGVNSNLAFTKSHVNPEAASTDGIYTSNPAVFARLARPDDSPNYYTLDANGKAIWGERADYLHYSKLFNPYFFNDYRDRISRNVTLNMNIFEEITPIKGLTLRASQALDAFDYLSNSKNDPLADYTNVMGDAVSLNKGSGSASAGFERYYNFTYTHTAEYKFNLNSTHYFTFLLGQESIINKDYYFSASRSGMLDRRLMLLSSGTSDKPSVSESISQTVFNSYFFRAAYNYAEKYYFDASFRRDGSSRFAPNKKWGNFWSLGAKWDLKKENFLNEVKWLDQLDLHASYGSTGNASIGDYSFIGLVSPGGVYNGENSLVPSNPSNPDLTWETVKAANIGVGFRVFHRLTVGAEFYSKKTTDMLMSIPYSFTTGYSSGMGNIGSMTNKGVDIDANVDIISNSRMNWSFKANMNYNKNKITALFNGQDSYVIPNTGLKLQVGKSYGDFYVVKRLGIDPRDGKQIWEDYNGNPTKVYNEDRDSKFSGKQRYAPWSGGFGTSFSWNGLTISADCTWALGKYATNNDRYFFENSKFGTSYNQSTSMLDMWTTPGQITSIPKAGEEIRFDDHLLENASFLRLKNVTVSYAFPQKLVKKTKILEGFSIFAIGRNLLTATKYTGYDPEPDINVIQFNYPNTKQFVFGCEITF